MVTKNICGGYNLRKAFGILIIVASISIIIFQPVQAKSEKSKILFSDNFNDNDISDWDITTNGNADVIADNGAMRLRVYKCSNAYTARDLGELNGNITIDFDYTILSEGWWEGAKWKLFVDNVEVAGNGNGFMGAAYGSTGGHVTQSVTTKGKARLQYLLEQSWACSFGDHFNTYYWIDNVTIKKSKP